MLGARRFVRSLAHFVHVSHSHDEGLRRAGYLSDYISARADHLHTQQYPDSLARRSAAAVQNRFH